MKRKHRHILILIFSFLYSVSYSQTADKATEFYLAGNDAVAIRKYALADSLYTLSLNIMPHPDTYYNRATVRKRLKDMKGYCIDIGNAANMRDTVALREFWKDCGKVDTNYYDKNNQRSTKQDFEFYEIITGCIYTTDAKYSKYAKPKKRIVEYEVKNNDTLFFLTEIPPHYPQGESQVIENIKYIYPPKEERNGKKQAIVVMSYTILKTGEISDINASVIGFSKEYTQTLIDALKTNTKKWRPAEQNGRKVKFRKNAMFVIAF